MSTDLAERRRRRGLTQAELAHRSGVPQPNISAHETGRRPLGPVQLDRVLAALRPLPSEALREHRDEILDIVRAHGGRTVRVFGSTAAGSDTPDSDLDLLVDTAPGTSLVDVMRMELDLEDLLEVRVDIVHDDGRGPVVESARATARPL
ncbi:nucleotidyltransferase domain-containing protein [Cellulomonas sp. PSBB021]|uniref:nucleotidyltransferase domain-containing protein n=1 Tax=Cellulomonas sp. PSBB021 TaxID=2003551 RepID=UPI000B8D2F8F|nr:nucleotidyltransferase domain-containing protein [Cellulomonas sp. PSBB021]ASR55588.1 hypothetical protein CBP52_11355 [Cellulomonas sp. PSBB021]